ncbi:MULTISPECIES: M24 family metallopeptidase [unclassified Pseudofrankia]|uniref:M24 family metallopeptidase n=1 Tax=unclassified Pseudofrankia TaxID=2994372 RepID=UPI0008D8F088|nr:MULTISPECIES: M24 family metallopeptidase [unclassified Pseudofrankia]MDT3446856.1 M24 family metallopeptidase [Pseudofrankia sp. BMG5.37]OHV54725.1 hypothetical protein BCD48_44430 [Pseudofrankia sp. BMG5.36]
MTTTEDERMSHTVQHTPWSERVRMPTPKRELDRRWAAVRTAMASEGIEVLIVHNHVDNLGGYVKYLGDIASSGGYPLTFVFPLEDAMTMVAHGPHGRARDVSPTADPLFYGIKQIVGTWSFASASYTAQYDPEAIAKAVKPYAPARIGILGMAQFPHLWMTYLQEALPKAEFVDASYLVDPIKAVKSEDEQRAIRATIEMQKAAFEAGLDAIEPGRREWEVIAAIAAATRDRGSVGGVLMIGSAPPGHPGMIDMPRHHNRVLQAGDQMTLLVEPSSVDGYFAEIGRTIVIGSANDALLEEHEFALAAYQRTVNHLRPGASSSAIFSDYNAFMEEHGRPPEQRLHAHGQGYDIVERPLIRSDEPMLIEQGMFLAVHPFYVHGGAALLLCDYVLIGSDGASAPLHGVEQKVFEV